MLKLLSLLCILLLAAPVQAKAGGPRLTLLFSANSEGEARACPTWGGKTTGGLARRASAQNAFKQGATSSSPVLLLAGGYEFVQNEAFKPPTKKRLEFLAKAYDALRYDVLFVTSYEREVLAKAGVAARPSWKGSQRLEQHMLSLDGKHKVAVLLLPPAPKGARALPQNLIHQVENAVQSLRGKVKLVVAMSPWGYNLEQELLKSQGPHPDVLLGSGQGIGLAGMIVGEGRTVWVRSFSQGKALSCIEVLAWPDENSTFKWTEGKNIRMTLFGLTDQYQEDPAMLTLMHNMGTD